MSDTRHLFHDRFISPTEWFRGRSLGGHREAPNAYGADVGSQSADTIKLNFIRCGRAADLLGRPRSAQPSQRTAIFLENSVIDPAPACGSFGNCRERSLSVDVHQ
jgi:hypothetical protein